MARLADAEGRALTLELQGYQHEDASAVDNDFDANWVMVRAAAEDGATAWEASGPAFLTWELLELSDRLRATTGEQPFFFSGFQPELQFEWDPTADPPVFVAVFAGSFLPEHAGKADELPLTLAVTQQELRRFADEIAAGAAAVPVRAVQPDGYASKVLAERSG